jgi:RNA polymerase sigma factor (sigma-70 family)
MPEATISAVRHLRIYLSSPGDVAAERSAARLEIERVGKEPGFRNQVKLDPIVYDDPDVAVPMLANLQPQDCVNRALVPPSACEIVVVLFWGRMGTPLVEPTRPDGTQYLSGTEWEFENARAAQRDILLYRRTARVTVDIDDPELELKRDQRRLVDAFFERLRTPSGGWSGSFTAYEGPTDFTDRFGKDIRALVTQVLERDSERGTTGKDAEHPGRQEFGTLPDGRSDHPSRQTRRIVSPPRIKYVGRDAEVGHIARLVVEDACKPIAILGGPGMGKSTVALGLCQDPEVVKHFKGERAFVRCDAASSAEVLVETICHAVGVEPDENQTARDALLRALNYQKLLLVVDNLEAPWEADHQAVEELLQEISSISSVVLLVTMRGTERPMGVDWQTHLVIPPLPMEQSRALFALHAADSLATDQALDGMLQQLGGIPLAVLLLANTTQGEPSLVAVRQRWQQERTRMLRRSLGGTRLDNLSVSLELSFGSARMTPEALRLVDLLALLPEGIGHQDLALVAPSIGLNGAATLRRLALAFDENERLSILAPIREHVKTRGSFEQPDRDTAMGYYRALISSHGASLKFGAIERLKPELRNIEVAIQEGLASSIDEAWRASLALANTMLRTGIGSLAFLEEIVTHMPAEQSRAARLRHAIGSIAVARTLFPVADRQLNAALQEFSAQGDRQGRAECLKALGELALAQERYVEAAALYEEAARQFLQLESSEEAIECEGRVVIARAKVQPSTASGDAAEALFLGNLEVIDTTCRFLARRYSFTQEDTEEFGSVVRLKLIERNYETLRRYTGQCSLRTYLITVIRRMAEDYQSSHRRRWRPSSIARALGPLAVRLEQLMHSEGMGEEQAISAISTIHPDATRTTLRVLADALPAAQESQQSLNLQHWRSIAASSVGSLPESLVMDEEREAVVAKATAALADIVSGLDSEDQELLRLRFDEEKTVAEIARSMDRESKFVYRRIDSLLSFIRGSLVQQGVGREALQVVFSGPGEN